MACATINVAVVIVLLAIVPATLAAGSLGYDYDGRDSWDTLVAFPECAGSVQSPINIPYSGSSEDLPLVPNAVVTSGSCNSLNLVAIFDGSKSDIDWEVTAGSTCKAVAGGKSFTLAQFHIHSPSEHTVNGVTFDAELHFVHVADDGSGFLVTGLLLSADGNTEDAYLDGAFEPLAAFDASTPNTEVLVTTTERESFYPGDNKWYHYSGSLTTPPCTEAVDWWLAATPVTISTEQLDLIRSSQILFPVVNAAGENNRLPQPINGRSIEPFTNPGACTSNSDCADANACTTEQCFEDRCWSSTEPECTPCLTIVGCAGIILEDPLCTKVTCSAGTCNVVPKKNKLLC